MTGLLRLAAREVEHVEVLNVHPADEASQGSGSADKHDCSTRALTSAQSLSLLFENFQKGEGRRKGKS